MSVKRLLKTDFDKSLHFRFHSQSGMEKNEIKKNLKNNNKNSHQKSLKPSKLHIFGMKMQNLHLQQIPAYKNIMFILKLF